MNYINNNNNNVIVNKVVEQKMEKSLINAEYSEINSKMNKIKKSFSNYLEGYLENLKKYKAKKEYIKETPMQTYMNLTQDILDSLDCKREIKEKITEKVFCCSVSHIESNNNEEKNSLEEAMKLACFCIWLSNTTPLKNTFEEKKILEIISNNNIKDLYNNSNNIFKEIPTIEKFIPGIIEFLKNLPSENKTNPEEIKKEILKDLKTMEKKIRDEANFSDKIKILYKKNIKLINFLKNKGIKNDILEKIKNNMSFYEELKFEDIPEISIPQIVSMKLLYTFLSFCYKNDKLDENTKFLKTISEYEISDLAYKENIEKIIETLDKKDFIKIIYNKITKNIDKEILINKKKIEMNKSKNEDYCYCIVKSFENNIEKKALHSRVDFLGIGTLKDIITIFNFYHEQCINMLTNSSLSLNKDSKELLLNKILNFKIPENSKSNQDKNTILSVVEMYLTEKNYARGIKLINLLLYIAKYTNDTKIIDSIRKYNLENIKDNTDKLINNIANITDKSKTEIYKIVEFTPK